jgi:hypothetical protein
VSAGTQSASTHSTRSQSARRSPGKR